MPRQNAVQEFVADFEKGIYAVWKKRITAETMQTPPQNQVKQVFQLEIVLGDPWKTLFEVAVAHDGLRPALPILSIVRDGKRVLQTTCPATSQRLSGMKELAGKPVEFRPINRTIDPQKYVISGVPQDTPRVHSKCIRGERGH